MGKQFIHQIAKKVLDELLLEDKDELLYSIEDSKIILEPKREEKLIDKLFEGYDLDTEYPFEVVEKGGAVGEELY